MRVVLIGSGNVATVLGRRIKQAGHKIVQVFSRNRDHALRLAEELSCPCCDDWAAISGEGDVYLVALADNALSSIGERLSLSDKLVLHTAGAVPRDVLRDVSKNYGVLYPLQSLVAAIRAEPEIPMLVDGNSPASRETIMAFARTISGRVEVADDETRLKLHLAGVLVNNFSNHLYRLAEAYCQREGIGFDLLLPLIGETSGRLSVISPEEAQTGPAVRGDEATIERHLKLLNNYKNISELYKLFTFQIKDENKKKRAGG